MTVWSASIVQLMWVAVIYKCVLRSATFSRRRIGARILWGVFWFIRKFIVRVCYVEWFLYDLTIVTTRTDQTKFCNVTELIRRINLLASSSLAADSDECYFVYAIQLSPRRLDVLYVAACKLWNWWVLYYYLKIIYIYCCKSITRDSLSVIDYLVIIYCDRNWNLHSGEHNIHT
jgi:hypothetical protein